MVQTRQKRGKQTNKDNAESPSKDPKSSSTQSQSAATPALNYPDWASYQAYYNHAAGTNVTTPGFPPQVASSPQGHPPYMWGPQMSPYGTPYVMYPHGGVYPYPSVQPGAMQYTPYPMQSANGTMEASEKSNKSKSEKKSKGKKKSESSSNGTSSQSGESESDDSSEGSSSSTKKALSSGKETSQKCSGSGGGRGRKKSNSSTPTSAPQQQQQMVVSPAMPPFWAIPPAGYAAPGAASGTAADYWAAAAAAAAPAAPATPITMTVKAPTPRRNLVQVDPNTQDERELKRQRRKQSNRESARRSRLKKQAEWELVAKCAADLKQENESLKEELKRLQEECDKLTSENTSLQERINESSQES